MKYINEVDIQGKRVLCRFDYNVPQDDTGAITDDTRIRETLATIRYALGEGAKVIIMAHLGRPKGKRNPAYTLAPVAKHLSGLLQRDVAFLDDCIGEGVAAHVAAMKPGDIALLENLRFYAEEEINDAAFARKLAAVADVYVDDAFGCAHRGHASNEAITRCVPVCAGGFLLKNEITYFEKCLGNPAKPLVAIIGGSKVSGKLEVLVNLIQRVDRMIIGGGMAFTFLQAQGCSVGKSLVENDLTPKALEVIDRARALGVDLLLPVDCIAARTVSADAETRTLPVQAIDPEWMGLDIGPASIDRFRHALEDARTVIWNGPLGVFEIEAFSRGTFAIAEAVVSSGALSVVGGGDTDVAIHKAGVSDKISYISTGGGAFLELLEGKTLPGIAALEACGA